MKASHPIELDRTVCGRPSRPPWFSLSHCQRRKTRAIRGDHDPAESSPSAVSVLRQPDNHRSRTAAQTSARPTTPADLDSPGPLSSVSEDLYGTARLVAGVRTLQPRVPATSLGVAAPTGRHLGTVRSRGRRPVAIARPIHGATMGRAIDTPGGSADSEVPASCRVQRRHSTHHSCLGLDRPPPYSAAGG